MIDFQNASYLKLSEIDITRVAKDVEPIVIDGEKMVAAYKGMRDYVVFTDKRVISVNVQGITGKKVDFTSLPYKNIVAYSVETAGTFDLDAELDLWFSGLGKVRFEFKGKSDIKEINRIISKFVLQLKQGGKGNEECKNTNNDSIEVNMKIGRTKQGVLYWTDYIDGKRVKRESKKWKYKYHAQDDYDNYTAEDLPVVDLTFSKLFEKYLEFSSLKNKKSYLNQMKYDVNKYAVDLLEMKIDKITPSVISKWQGNLLKSKSKKGTLLSNSYLNSIQTYVRAIFRFGIEHQISTNNPAATMIIAKRTIPVVIEEKRVLTLAEFNSFVEKIEEIEYHAFFNVLYWCGLRMGEAIALTLNDYKDNRLLVSKNYDGANQIITTTKTGSNRYVDVPKRCTDVLDNLINHYRKFDHNKDSALFGLYKRLSPTTIRRKKDEAVKTSGIKQFKIHDLRHSHVSILIDLGFSAFEISKRLGHSTEMVNNTYGHLFPSKQQAMVDKLNDL